MIRLSGYCSQSRLLCAGQTQSLFARAERKIHPGLACSNHYQWRQIKTTNLEMGVNFQQRISRHPIEVKGIGQIACFSSYHFGSNFPRADRNSTHIVFNDRRLFHSSNKLFKPKEELKVLDEKSKVEEYVDFQRKKKEKESQIQMEISQQALKDAFIYMPQKQEKAPAVESKKSLWERTKHEVMHYYNGFRLLYLEARVSGRLLWQVLNGKSLSRRERRQFLRTVSDLFRLVPFSIFLIVPFMEFLLPVAVKLFPNMLPSTFEDKSKQEETKRKQLKLKLQMAEFLQDTIEEISVVTNTKKSKEKLKEFGSFIEKVRSGWEQPSTKDILKFSKVFEDEVTLDNLPHEQLKAICRMLMISPYGTSNYLRFTIKIKMKQLKADDQMIRTEGIENLSVQELQSACAARGMRALGVPSDRLLSQLQQWLELSLDEDIPASLLLLSRAMYVREPSTDENQLKVTISMLPDRIVDEVECKIAATEGGVVDKQTLIDIIKYEEQVIKEEKAADKAKLKIKEKDDSTKDEDTSVEKEFSKEEINIVKEKISSERDELDKIKFEREDYKEDVNELLQEIGDERATESAASRVLGKRVDRLIEQIDRDLEIRSKNEDQIEIDADRDGMVSIDELSAALSQIDGTSVAKAKQISEILDENKDGIIEVEEMKKILDLISDEDLDMNTQQAADIVQLIKQSTDIFAVEQILVKGKTNAAVSTVVKSLLKR